MHQEPPRPTLGQDIAVSATTLETLARLASSLAEGELVFAAITEATVRLLGAAAARVWIDDPDEQLLREKGCFGIDRATARMLCDRPELKYAEGIVGTVFVSGCPKFTVDIQEEPSFRNQRFAQVIGLHAHAALPLTVGDRVLGVLSILFREARAFTSAEHEVMRLLANQATVAVNTARLIEQNERRRQAAETLVKLTRSVTQSLDTRDIASRTAESVRDQLGAHSAAVFRLDPGSGDHVLLAACGDIASVFDDPGMVSRGVGIPASALGSGVAVMIEDILTDPRVALTPELRARLRTTTCPVVLSAPLVANDVVIGLLTVWDRAGRLYSLEEIDLAQAVAAQAALALENARLYEEARQSYTELHETQHQLAQTQKMEAIGRLAGGVAHDFNNLLTVIVGRAELSQRRAACDVATQDDLALIAATATRAARLTRQLLAFSRKQTLQPKILDPNDLVAEMSKMLRRLIGEDIELVTHLSPGAGLIKADPGQIEQVIMNLVVNARDAMPRGGQLTLETEASAVDKATRHGVEPVPPGVYVVLRVTDTGDGMDAETQSHIFEPFFTTKERGQGTGLGLATVYGIVKQSGGHIAVTSAPGRGTTFNIYLPQVAGRPGPVEPGSEAVGEGDGAETILVAEDEAEVRRLIAGVLKGHGYTILEARNGEEGARLAAQYPGSIDLLLTDVVMPGASGPELAERFGRRRPDVPVLYMSGYTDDALTHHAVTNTAERLLHKPFSPSALVQKVRETLDSSRGGLADLLSSARM